MRLFVELTCSPHPLVLAIGLRRWRFEVFIGPLHLAAGLRR